MARLNVIHITYDLELPATHTNVQVLKMKDSSASELKPMKNIVLLYGQEEKTRKYA